MATLILNSLEVRNFRAFHDLKIERLGRVNLIVGKNNVGKTSLLEALQLYARRASTATHIWDIMRSRREMRQPFTEVRDMLATLKYLFYGRKDVLPGLEPIEIGTMNVPGKTLFIGVDWSVFYILPDGRNGVRPLKPDEEYIADNLVPRLFIQADNSQVSFQLDPSAPPGGYKLNANEIPLESKKGEITATLYDKRELDIAAREQIEVR